MDGPYWYWTYHRGRLVRRRAYSRHLHHHQFDNQKYKIRRKKEISKTNVQKRSSQVFKTLEASTVRLNNTQKIQIILAMRVFQKSVMDWFVQGMECIHNLEAER